MKILANLTILDYFYKFKITIKIFVVMIFRQVCYSCSPYSVALLSVLIFTSRIIIYPYLISNLVTYFKILTTVKTLWRQIMTRNSSLLALCKQIV